MAIFGNLFKEINCACCGKKTSALARIELDDGNFVCTRCASPIPNAVRKCLGDSNLEQFHATLDYVNNTMPAMKKKFKMAHYFHGLELDTLHGWMRYGGVFFPVENVTGLAFEFIAKEYNSGGLLSSERVEGDIQMRLEVSFPHVFWEETIGFGVKAPAKKKFFGNKVTYENPKELDEFETYFSMAHTAAMNKQAANLAAQFEMPSL